MDIRLQDLIIWMECGNLQVAIIIDWFEIFIDHSINLTRKSTQWNYKHKNTAKVMIGILPQRVVGLISEAMCQ